MNDEFLEEKKGGLKEVGETQIRAIGKWVKNMLRK